MNSIVKNVLTSLKDKKLSITPENYFKEFKSQADISNKNIDELKLFEEIKNSLSKNEIEQNSNIQSFNELSKVLAKRVNDDELKDF